ncbi:MAG: ATP-dependent DNA ligase, partial [Planctomycetota bacterium]
MNEFCELFWRLDSTTKTNEKIHSIKHYLDQSRPEDAVWAIYFLTGKRIQRLIPMKLIRTWAMEQSKLSDWLFAECYDRVGDLAETISLILPPPTNSSDYRLRDLIEKELLPIPVSHPTRQKETVLKLWSAFDQPARFILGKLMTGAFRVGVSKGLVQRALAQWSGVERTVIARRMMGDWQPTLSFFETLVDPTDDGSSAISQPYPFFLANAIKDEPELFLPDFKAAENWIAEWKWDGIRAQLVKRQGEVFVWSRGEELITDQFPEIVESANSLPDGLVLDGEILAWSVADEKPLPFQQLQRRLGRKNVNSKTMANFPVVFLAFDLLEHETVDIRQTPLIQRQAKLEKVVERLSHKTMATRNFLFAEMENQRLAIRLPEKVEGSNWNQWTEQRERSKQFQAEGLMLKRKDSTYQVGRPVGDWWKWKVDPFTIDAVLVYAQRGHGRRASLYTDFTFAVWEDGELIPFAKAYSGLTDKEIREVDAFVRKNTHESFGPVRSVTPTLVFELAFENIQISSRHKSGIAVRFPRISRWRHDKKP